MPPPMPGMAASSSGVPADIPVPPARAGASKALQVAYLHEAIYTRQCDGNGRLRPSRKAVFDPRLVDVQRACRHPLTRLSWQGNQHAQYASCGLCGLKHGIYVEKSAVHMTRPPSPDPPVPHGLHLVDMPAGYAMLDTGCKTSVGGSDWHQALQA